MSVSRCGGSTGVSARFEVSCDRCSPQPNSPSTIARTPTMATALRDIFLSSLNRFSPVSIRRSASRHHAMARPSADRGRRARTGLLNPGFRQASASFGTWEISRGWAALKGFDKSAWTGRFGCVGIVTKELGSAKTLRLRQQAQSRQVGNRSASSSVQACSHSVSSASDTTPLTWKQKSRSTKTYRIRLTAPSEGQSLRGQYTPTGTRKPGTSHGPGAVRNGTRYESCPCRIGLNGASREDPAPSHKGPSAPHLIPGTAIDVSSRLAGEEPRAVVPASTRTRHDAPSTCSRMAVVSRAHRHWRLCRSLHRATATRAAGYRSGHRRVPSP